jgi:hypothetical protein
MISLMRWLAAVAVPALCVTCLGSCEISDDRVSNSETGSSPESGTRAAPDSDVDAVAERGNSVTDDAAPRCAAAQGLPPECSAVDSGVGDDAGTPPADCIAPCVWELIRHCPPISSCGVDANGYCGFRGACSLEVCSANMVCYRYDVSTVPPFGAFPRVSWSDAEGRIVAEGYGGANGGPLNVVCGELCMSYNDAGLPVYVPCARGASTHRIDSSQPHCVPWRAY